MYCNIYSTNSKVLDRVITVSVHTYLVSIAGTKYKLIKFVTILKYCGILLKVLIISKLSLFLYQLNLDLLPHNFLNKLIILDYPNLKLLGIMFQRSGLFCE